MFPFTPLAGYNKYSGYGAAQKMQLNDVIRLIHRMISEQVLTETIQHTDMGK